MSARESVAADPSRALSAGRSRSCLAVALAFLFAHAAYLIATRRCPVGHDTLQYLTLQYSVLNNVVTSGEVPLWLPFMTQGTVSNWWYALQAAPFQGVLLLLSGVLEGVNFLPLFYVGMLFDEIVLLVGTWLLARRYFQSDIVVLYVALSILGSAVWTTQPWYDFHLYSSVPLILHFGHELIDGAKSRYLFAAGALLAAQMLGNLPYLIPVTSAVIFVYFVFVVLCVPGQRAAARSALSRLSWWRAAAACAGVAISFGLVYFVLNHGTEPIENYNLGRNADATVSLEGFMSYATGNPLLQWSEAVTGIPFRVDYNLFFGGSTLAFMALAVLPRPERPALVFVGCALTFWLFLAATPVTTAFYYAWPMMKYFRHISLVAPFVKLFLCFLAGFGFERALRLWGSESKGHRIVLALSAAGLVVLAAVFSDPRAQLVLASELFTRFAAEDFLPTWRAMATRMVLDAFTTRAVWLIVAAVALLARLWAGRAGGRTSAWAWALAVLCLHATETFQYKLWQHTNKTVVLEDAQYALFEFQETPYAPRRSVDYSANPRFRLSSGVLFDPSMAFYWSNETFFFLDAPSSIYRTDHWLSSLDDFLRACTGVSRRTSNELPPFARDRDFTTLEFPWRSQLCATYAGLTEDKIQFFSDANVMATDDDVARVLRGSSITDGLWVNPPADGSFDVTPTRSSDAIGRRVALPYSVSSFDANHIEIAIDMVAARKQAQWLFYSDAWHPFWTAEIDGKAAPVWKAMLGYKAVQLEPGSKRIRFAMSAPALTHVSRVLHLVGALWFGLIIYLLARLLIFGRGSHGNVRS